MDLPAGAESIFVGRTRRCGNVVDQASISIAPRMLVCAGREFQVMVSCAAQDYAVVMGLAIALRPSRPTGRLQPTSIDDGVGITGIIEARMLTILRWIPQ